MRGNELLGYVVLLRLPVLAQLLEASSLDLNGLLGAQEKQMWELLATVKRRLEFLGGRIAAKVADRFERRTHQIRPHRWSDIQILPDLVGFPGREYRDGTRRPVAISHSGAWAIAAAGINARMLSVDLEDARCRRVSQRNFHPLEQFQIRSSEDARLRWCLKEACAKFTGVGIQGYQDNVLVLDFEGQLWVGLCRSHVMLSPAILAGASLAPFGVAFAIGEVPVLPS